MPRSFILMLETDEIVISRVTIDMMEDRFEVISASSFKEAFQKIKTQSSSLALIVLDFELATDDVDIYERLRKIEFDYPIPIVLMGQVPLTEAEVKPLLQSTGYDGYLYKSMPSEEMKKTILSLAVPPDERRIAPRIYYKTRAHCTFEDKNYLAYTYTLSTSGVFLEFDQQKLDIGTCGEITFNAAIEGEQSLTLECQIVHVRIADPQVVSIHPPGIALKFKNIGKDDENTLLRLIEHEVQMGNISNQ